MARNTDFDPLQEYGTEAAVIILVGGIAVSVAMVIYAVMQGEALESAVPPALAVAVIGAGVAALIMSLRKRQERATRPEWMGSTQEWREGLISKHELSKGAAPDSGDHPPA